MGKTKFPPPNTPILQFPPLPAPKITSRQKKGSLPCLSRAGCDEGFGSDHVQGARIRAAALAACPENPGKGWFQRRGVPSADRGRRGGHWRTGQPRLPLLHRAFATALHAQIG